jgi:hypothetical protein
MSEADFNSTVDSLDNDGLVPFDVSAYEVGGATRYAGIWTDFPSPQTLARSAALGHRSCSHGIELRRLPRRATC